VFFLVASKLENRFYVVIETEAGYQCSACDERVAARRIDQVKAYQTQKAA
jgi:hypothetical protein